MREEFYVEEEATLEETAVECFWFLSIGAVRRAIVSGEITLNGRHAAADEPVSPGDAVCYDGPEGGIRETTVAAGEVEVLFEDESIIAVNKPAGVTVVPERGEREWEFMAMMAAHAKECAICKGAARFRVVHRIDRDTTGVVVLAKTAEAGRALTAAFAAREVSKKYLAIVKGEPAADEGVIDAPLGLSGRKVPLMAVVEGGKRSVTRWRVVERFRGYALVEARPETGRTHQIRAHMAYAGMPLAVDEMYGGGEALALSAIKRGYKRSGPEKPLIARLTLHAREIEFAHPVTGETVRIEALVAEDISKALKALGKWGRRGGAGK